MFKSRVRKVLMGAFFALACAGTAQSAQLITNGGFEAGGTGWTTTPRVDFYPVSAYDACCSPFGVYPHGSNAAFFGAGDMAGGTLYQDVLALSGGSYTLSFAYGAISLPNLQQMAVSIFDIAGGGSTFINGMTIGAFGTQNLAAMMAPYSIGFTATSDRLRILFSDISPSTISTDGVLDNVALMGPAPIPEPSTYALMIAGLGIVIFMARRRKKQQPALA